MTKEQAIQWVLFAQSVLSIKEAIIAPRQYDKIKQACEILGVEDLRTYRRPNA